MAKKYINPYLGSEFKILMAEQMKNEEFAQAYELEKERLNIAHQVKAMREKKNMTQGQLAELIGTKQPSIARLEAGNYWLRIDMLQKIAWALGSQPNVRFVKKTA